VTAAKAKPKGKLDLRQRDEKGRLLKGQTANPHGKAKGTKNLFTREMTDMVTKAMELAGEDAKKITDPETKKLLFPEMKGVDGGTAYLYQQARMNPQLFMPLVKQLMPTKIDMDVKLLGAELVDLMTERRNQLANMRDVTPTKRGKK